MLKKTTLLFLYITGISASLPTPAPFPEEDDAPRTASEESVGRVPIPKVDFQHRRRDSTHLYKSSESVLPLPTVDMKKIYDRNDLIRRHVEQLISEEKMLERNVTICRCLYMNWITLGALTTLSSMILSSIGAAEYLNSRLVNVLTAVLAVVSSACLYGAKQSAVAAKIYTDKIKTLQRLLGIPERLISPDIQVQLETFHKGSE